jgi:hypothetical protein
MTPKAKRQDKLQFQLDLNKDKVEKHLKHIAIILGQKEFIVKLDADDMLKINYDLHIQYFGDVVERLEALNSVLNDPEVLLNISTKELRVGFCLIENIFKQIEAIKTRLKV